MSLETRVVALAEVIGGDIKNLLAKQGDLTSLTTTEKTSLVGALNELKSSLSSAGSGSDIDDEATGSGSTWSSTKIAAQISAAISALVDSSPAALDTLSELAAALNNDASFSTTVATALSKRVRYDDEQTLSSNEKQQACTNIGVGNPERDFAGAYAAAKV